MPPDKNQQVAERPFHGLDKNPTSGFECLTVCIHSINIQHPSYYCINFLIFIFLFLTSPLHQDMAGIDLNIEDVHG